jgi:RNA polymerase primary sigma factor/RNA polymerase sigma factor
LNEQRAAKIMELQLDFIPNPVFEDHSMAESILSELPVSSEPTRKVKAPSGLPAYLASLYDVPLLTREQEYHLFRKMNYLKHAAAEMRDKLDLKMPSVAMMEQIEKLYEKSVDVKNKIVQSNLRLVVSIAKRHLAPNDDFFGLISDGNMSLIRAAEKFDYSRGNKFSTYASWAIMKNFARTIPDEFKHQDRFRTSNEEVFDFQQDRRADNFAMEIDQATRTDQIQKILHTLDQREQQIIVRRFGLDHRFEPLTLKEVGEAMGVTKERVRQLEARALSKLRAAANQAKIDLPE